MNQLLAILPEMFASTSSTNASPPRSKPRNHDVWLLDHICIEEKILQPTGGQYLVCPKHRSEVDVPA